MSKRRLSDEDIQLACCEFITECDLDQLIAIHKIMFSDAVITKVDEATVEVTWP